MTTAFIRIACILPLCLTLVACGEDTSDPHGNGTTTTSPEEVPKSWGTPPEQLEAVTVSGVAEYSELVTSGALEVAGSERDFTISVAAADGDVSYEVHSSTQANLAELDGKAARVTFGSVWTGDTTVRSVVIEDDAGSPLYLAHANGSVDLDATFGAGFVSYGEPVAVEVQEFGPYVEGYVTKSWTPLVFATDDGKVSVSAGEVARIRVKGVTYRVGVISAIDVDYVTSEDIACGPSSTMIFELLRVQAPPTPMKLQRPTGFGPAQLGCG